MQAVAVILPAILLLYIPGITTNYFGDDYNIYSSNPARTFFTAFFENSPLHGMYRPLEATYLGAVQYLWQENTIAIHTMTILLHTMTSCLIVIILFRIGVAFKPALLAGMLMASSQINTMGILNNDTISQMAVTFFGLLCLYFLGCAFAQPPNQIKFWQPWQGVLWLNRRSPETSTFSETRETQPQELHFKKYLWYGVGAYALCIFSKESGISFFLMAGLFLLLQSAAGQRAAAKNQRSIIVNASFFSFFFIITAAYMLLRSRFADFQPSIGHEQYEFNLGLNILKNGALFLLATMNPISSVATFQALKLHHTATLVWVLSTTILFGLIITIGLCATKRKALTGLIVIFFILAFFPAILLNHVSELYVYAAMPFFCMLCAFSFEALLNSQRFSRTVRMLVAAFLIAIIIINGIGVHAKVDRMVLLGKRATQVLAQLLPYSRTIGIHDTLFLFTPPPSEPEYSSFSLSGFNVLNKSLDRLYQLTGKEFAIVLDTLEPGRTIAPGPSLKLCIDTTDYHVYDCGKK